MRMWNYDADNGQGGKGAWVEVPDHLVEDRWKRGYDIPKTEMLRVKIPDGGGGWRYDQVPAEHFQLVLNAGGHFETIQELQDRKDKSEWGGAAGTAAAIPLGLAHGLGGSMGDALVSYATGMDEQTIKNIAEFHPAAFTTSEILGFGGGLYAGGTAKLLPSLARTGTTAGKLVEGAKAAAHLVPAVGAGRLGMMALQKVGKATGVATRQPGLAKDLGLISSLAAQGAVEGAVWRGADLIGEELLGRADRTAGEILHEVGVFSALSGGLNFMVGVPLGSMEVAYRNMAEGTPFSGWVAKKIDKFIAGNAAGDSVQTAKLLQKIRENPKYFDDLLEVDDALHAAAEGYAGAVDVASATIKEAQKMHGSNYKDLAIYKQFVATENSQQFNTAGQLLEAKKTLEAMKGGIDRLLRKGVKEGATHEDVARHFRSFAQAINEFDLSVMAEILLRHRTKVGKGKRAKEYGVQFWELHQSTRPDRIGETVWREVKFPKKGLGEREHTLAQIEWRENANNLRAMYKSERYPKGDKALFLKARIAEKHKRTVVDWIRTADNKRLAFTEHQGKKRKVYLDDSDSFLNGYRSLYPRDKPMRLSPDDHTLARETFKSMTKAEKGRFNNRPSDYIEHLEVQKGLEGGLDRGVWEWAAERATRPGVQLEIGAVAPKDKRNADLGAWLFVGLDDLKRTLRKNAKALSRSSTQPTATEARDLSFAALSRELTRLLERQVLWGKPAVTQKEINATWTELLSLWKPFKAAFTTKKTDEPFGGGRVGDVDKLKRYLKKRAEEYSSRKTHAHAAEGLTQTDHVTTQMMDETTRAIVKLFESYRRNYDPNFGEHFSGVIKKMKESEASLLERLSARDLLNKIDPTFGGPSLRDVRWGLGAAAGFGGASTITALMGGGPLTIGAVGVGAAIAGSLTSPARSMRMRASIQLKMLKGQRRIDGWVQDLAEKITGQPVRRAATGLRTPLVGRLTTKVKIPKLSKAWSLRTPIVGQLFKLGHEEPDRNKRALGPAARNAQGMARAVRQLIRNPTYMEHLFDVNLAPLNGAPKIQEEMRKQITAILTYLDSNYPQGMHETYSALGAEPDFMTTDAAADEYLQMGLTALAPIENLGQNMMKGTLTPVVITTMRNLYPERLDDFQARMLDALAGKQVDHDELGQLSILFERPLSPFHDGAGLKVLQSLYMKSDPRPNKGSMRALKNTAENVMPHTQRIV